MEVLWVPVYFGLHCIRLATTFVLATKRFTRVPIHYLSAYERVSLCVYNPSILILWERDIKRMMRDKKFAIQQSSDYSQAVEHYLH